MEGANRQLRLARRPEGAVDDTTFELVEEPLRPPADNEAIVRLVYLSVDPTQRVWIREEPSYLPPVGLGEVMRSGAIGTVVESRSGAFPIGAIVTGLLGWQEYAYVDAASAVNVVPAGLPMRQMMGVLGATGITAYFGMLDVAKANAGDVVVVSGAAGATGSVAAQIAKIQGCRVIGIAGTPEKCAWLTGELDLDAAIDYRTENVGARIAELCPDGVDVFFDNVGGATLDAVLVNLALRGRVALCGAISTYNDIEGAGPIRAYMNLVVKRARIEGFLVLDYVARFPEAVLQLATWVQEGRLQGRDQVVDGLEQAPDALNMLFAGENTGKLLVQVAPEPD